MRRGDIITNAVMSDSTSSEFSNEQLLRACEDGRLVDIRELVAGKKVELKNCVANNPHGDTPLHIAAYFGRKDIVQYLVEEEDCEVESRNRYQNTPLYRAARQGQLEVVKYLIEEKGSNPMLTCHWKRTPLHSACSHGQLAVVKYLTNTLGVHSSVKDALFEQTPLQLAAEWGTKAVVEHMLQHEKETKDLGQEPYSLLHLAAYGGKLETVQYLIEKKGYDPMIRDKKNRTPLHSACKGGNLEIVQYLVKNHGVDKSCRNNTSHVTPLDMAAENGHMQVVQYLVKNKRCPVIPESENTHSALHHAAYGGKMKVVQYLITQAKCDPSCRGWKGRTPLHSACSNGKYDVMCYLIEEHKVDPSVKDDMGITPLHLAAKQGRLPVIKQLVNKFKCSIDVEDNLSKTPLDYAAEQNHTAVADYLSEVQMIASDKRRKELEAELTSFVVSCTPTGKKLGRGAYSTVIELSPNDNESVCLAGKVFKTNKSPKMMKEKLKRELQLMVDLKHENIVQCEGVCFLPSSMLPVLVMEKMKINLHDYLLDPDNSNLPVERKVSFLLDTARGLDYLHSHTPAIIHQDLTAKNVLLDSQLRAKMSDFGNSRFEDSTSRGTMTTVPGTLDYMPPEALGGGATHNPSLDVFSFGHLSLFTLVQTPLRPLLPVVDTTGKQYRVRHEVERREKFFTTAQKTLLLSESHPLLKLIKQCIHNESLKRPQTKDLVKRLHEVKTSCGVSSVFSVEEPMETEPELDTNCADVVRKQVSIEKAESVVQEMLQKEGKIKQKNMVVVVTGLMEAGKTTLLYRLFGKDIPKKYSNTGVAEQSCRGITQYRFSIEQGIQLVENPLDMFQLVAKVKSVPSAQTLEKCSDEDITADEKTGAEEELTRMTPNTEDKLTDDNPTTVVHGSAEVEEEESMTPRDVSEVHMKPRSFDEMVNIVRQNPEKCFGELELLHMIDTGGQPECLEVMPSLIHNADLILLVVNLSQCLDEHTEPTFHEDGQRFCKKRLFMCNKQIIEQLAQTLSAKTEAHKNDSKILIVATHKDEVKEEDIQEKLNTLVRSVFPSDMLYSNKKTRSVFDVNLRDPDKQTIPRIRRSILENLKNMKEEKILILPPSFVMLEYEAMAHIKDLKEKGERKSDVIKLEECLKIGGRLGMERNTVEAALKYFHENNLFLFFKDVGSGLVFLDPKILIHFVNAIIRFSYTMVEGTSDGEEMSSLPILTESEMQSLSKGIITEDLLKNSYLADKFVPGLFEACHAIEIFKKLYTIAEHSQKSDRAPEYLMMCLLPRLSQDEFARRESLITMASKTKPLRIYFGVGDLPDWDLCCSPSGSFGSTIACLMSKYHWKTVDYEQPECLYHNMAMLRPSKMGLEVTLIDKTKYFKVFVNTENEEECKNLPKVRREIVSAVREVLKTMHVKMTVTEGFECTCGRQKQCHTQYILIKDDSTESSEYFLCTRGYREAPKSFWVPEQQGLTLQPKAGEGVSGPMTLSVDNKLLSLLKFGKAQADYITAQTKIEITPGVAYTCHWEGHGFKVHIPAGAIPEERGPVTLCIQASLSGDYQLPDDGVLVSGVYWLSLHPPVKRFDEKVTLSLQHCASDGDPGLSFVTAKCTQKTLPYKFESLTGGAFSEPGYGSILLENFSAFGISRKRSRRPLNYAIRTYFVTKQPNKYEAHITVTLQKELIMEKVSQLYKEQGAERGPTVSTVQLISDSISLDISQTEWINNGWRLCFLTQPCLKKEALDDYVGKELVPAFQIELKMIKFQSLEQRVGFVGVTPENSFVTITRDPPKQDAPLPEAPPPTLPDLLRLKIPRKVGTKYFSFGTLLLNDLTGSVVTSIEQKCLQDPVRIVHNILSEWLQGTGTAVTWKSLIKALQDADLNLLAQEVEEEAAKKHHSSQ